MRKVETMTVAELGASGGGGISTDRLSDIDLLRELGDVHRTRTETLRHGSDHALIHHDQRMASLEAEYLRRYPQREIDPQRMREGARARTDATDTFAEPGPAGGPGPRTGADQSWEPEDLAVAEGRDPTPRNVERARRELADDGPAAIERTVP